ncbi:uncharacterized protein UV8b_07076 [Ustilaginoidea virens]|uniref:FAD-binding FR-type domain-containing protein n=2 Tax=Ustilaginoidea virens TaxID=1159556 RepID=A0A8E5HWD4_USTVR|nr:uncharacterized protein UV8b_07076 [Ustilaginoidea virens]QUC22835.1 hypothetical protein UV8b_07076 [Ustilaginoidea virens]
MLLLPVLVALAACANAAKPVGRQVCVASCYYSLLRPRFAGTGDKDQAACANELRVRSTYYCVVAHCAEEDVEPGIGWWQGACKNSSRTVSLAEYHEASSNVSAGFLASLPTVELAQKDLVPGVALPSARSWAVVYRSTATYSHMRDYHNAVRWTCYGFWALVLLAGMAARMRPLVRRALPRHQLLHRMKRATRYKQFMLRGQPRATVIALYITVHIAASAAHYPLYDENYYYSSKKVQALRYFADRLGSLMSASLPWVFLFGSRSNPLVYMTGWSYATFSFFHRWVAIVLAVEGVLHGAVFCAFYVCDKGWDYLQSQLRQDKTLLYGILTIAAMVLSTVFALGLRSRYYEAFKLAHIALSAVALAAFYEHIKTQFGGAYRVWAWTCVAIWASDYLLRIARIVILNHKLLTGGHTPAVASFAPETGMIRLQVHPSAIPARQNPGQHYFLSFGRRPWESHPFSLAGWSSATPHAGEKSSDAGLRAGSPASLTFMIRPRHGITKRLREQLENAAGKCRPTVVLEGPYGAEANFGQYASVLFIAGGSGITAVLPYVRGLVDRRMGPRARLVWAVPQEAFAREVLANDAQWAESSPHAEGRFALEVYITGSGGPLPADSTHAEGYGPDARFRYARPSIDAVVRAFVEGSGPTAAVVVCGPDGMADEARGCVIRYSKASTADVAFTQVVYRW